MFMAGTYSGYTHCEQVVSFVEKFDMFVLMVSGVQPPPAPLTVPGRHTIVFGRNAPCFLGPAAAAAGVVVAIERA
jgi:hypothetical protein